MKKKTQLTRLSKKTLHKAVPLIKLLLRLTNEDRQTILNYLNLEACSVLCECVHNAITNQDVTCRKDLSDKTKSEKENIRFIVKPVGKSSLKQKKLVQIGGTPLMMLLSVGLPLLANYLRLKLK